MCRYLKGTPRVVQKVKIGVDLNNVVNVYVDSDWAGCTRTRRSTNGGCILLNGACLKTWSTTQTVVARSSAKAEYYAAVKGAAEGMAVQSMLADLGLKVTIEVHTLTAALAEEPATAVAWGNSDILMLHFYASTARAVRKDHLAANCWFSEPSRFVHKAPCPRRDHHSLRPIGVLYRKWQNHSSRHGSC